MIRSLIALIALSSAAADFAAPEFTIDLDAAPEKRWATAATSLLNQHGWENGYGKVIAYIDNLIGGHDRWVKLEPTLQKVGAKLAPEYQAEIKGLHDTVVKLGYGDHCTHGQLIFMQFYYEADNACTSIVAQRSNGTVFLARNQDYPPPFTLVMIHAVFTRGGKKMYEGTGYAGTIGLATGFVAGGWAASLNARGYALKGKPEGLAAALEAARKGAQIAPIFVRQAMDAITLRGGAGGSDQFAQARARSQPAHQGCHAPT